LRCRGPLGPNATAAERYADDRRENWEAFVFTAGLFLVALQLVCETLKNPVAFGSSLGSMVVAYFALAALLALLNAFEFAVSWATDKKWCGDEATPRAERCR